VAALAVVFALLIQLSPSTFAGTLRDPDGRPVPNVDVVLAQSGKAARRARTDASGTFLFTNVPPGDYDFESSVAGFVKRYPVEVRTGDRTEFDVLLQVSQVTETITVASRKGLPAPAPQPRVPTALRPYTPPPLPAYEPEADSCSRPEAAACLKPPIRVADVSPAVPIGREGDAATVVIEGEIGTDGTINPRLSESTDSQFSAAAMDAVRQWRFVPARLNGHPVSTTLRVTIHFVNR
jgi:TonB family protein